MSIRVHAEKTRADGDPSTGEIVTYTGRVVKPLDPDPATLTIADIAHALANSCRFTGHTRRFYSTAQHSYHVSQIVPPEIALTGLLHDAGEAYLSDISRPVKRQPEFRVFYRAAEDRILRAIAERFGIVYPFPHEVHWADDVLLRTEQRDLMPDLLRVPGSDYLARAIEPWLPAKAERLFLSRFHELTEG